MSEWVIIASGRSLCQADVDLVGQWRNGTTRRVIAINLNYQLAPWADVIYGCDHRFWKKHHADIFARCPGEKWAFKDEAVKDFGVRKARLTKTGGNSGYQSARLAITEFDATRIILLAFDMQDTGHWHPEHGDGWPNPKAKEFPSWRTGLKNLSREFSHVEFINCSRETALECFPIRPLEEVLELTRA